MRCKCAALKNCAYMLMGYFSSIECNDFNDDFCRCVTLKTQLHHIKVGSCDAAKQAGHHGIGSLWSP